MKVPVLIKPQAPPPIEILDAEYVHPSGQDKRRERRKKERNNKKK